MPSAFCTQDNAGKRNEAVCMVEYVHSYLDDEFKCFLDLGVKVTRLVL